MEYLGEALRALSQGWAGSVIGIVGLLVGITGVVLAIVFYRRSRANPCLAYQRRAVRLIGSSEPALPDEVQVSFRGVVVSRLTKTYILIWNAGNETIRGSDVVPVDPLLLVFAAGTQVLRASVVRTTRSVIRFHASPSPDAPSEAVWGFDYLDAGDGANIEVLHTGAERYPKVRGTIRGVPGMRDYGRILPLSMTLFGRFQFATQGLRLTLLTLAVFGIVIVAVDVLSPAVGATSRTAFGVPAWVSHAVSLLLYVVTPALMLWAIRRRFPRRLLGEELD